MVVLLPHHSLLPKGEETIQKLNNFIFPILANSNLNVDDEDML